MTKRLICLIILAAMVIGLLAACDSGPLTVEAAKRIVLKDLGTKESKLSALDVHIATVDGIACYAFYVTYNGENWEYVVNGQTGEILSKAETDHGHSH